MLISHGISDLLSCEFAETGYLYMPDKLMLHFPRIISLEQKYRHPVCDVPDTKSLQQVLLLITCSDSALAGISRKVVLQQQAT